MVVDHEVRARPLVPIVDRIPVPFMADGGGVDELSWGQRELWLAMQRRKVWIPLGTVFPLPEGTTVAEVAARLRFMVTRYPTMRTRLRLDPDTTRQVVADQGEVTLAIGEADPDADPLAAAERLSLQFMDQDLDVATDWPVRLAVLRHRGALTHQVLVMCHLVLDGAGAAVMRQELARWQPAGGTVTPCEMPPLEQVRRQRLPSAQRHSEAALRHWESLLRSAPARRICDLGGQRAPRFWKGCLTSSAIALAARTISARTGVDSPTVLLTLYAAALARMSGINPVLVQVMVSNRFRPGFARTVSPVAQFGLCLLDVAATTVDAAVRQTRRHALAAYKHAYYDPQRREELIAQVAQEGGGPELGVYFNDRRLGEPIDAGGAEATDPAPDAHRLRSALAASSFTWVTVEDVEFTDPVYLYVDATTRDGDPALDLTLGADTRLLTPERIEELVRDMEGLAVAAALDPETVTGVGRRAGHSAIA